MARKTSVEGVVYSNFKEKVLELLKTYGFVKNYEIIKDGKKRYLRIGLKSVENPINDIPNIKFFSKPSRPRYIGYKQIKTVASGK